MRFDAPEHVRALQKQARYPAIHDAIASYVRMAVSPTEGPLLDLCSSTGLLGRRLASVGYTVVAMQEPNEALRLGLAAGVCGENGAQPKVPVLEMKLARDLLDDFLWWVRQKEVDTVVARRAFPELWDALGGREGFGVLARGLLDAGVERIVLEGRAPTRKAIHPLSTGDAEAKELHRHGWRTCGIDGAVYELVPDSPTL